MPAWEPLKPSVRKSFVLRLRLFPNIRLMTAVMPARTCPFPIRGVVCVGLIPTGVSSSANDSQGASPVINRPKHSI